MDVRHLKGHKKIALDTMVFIYYFEDNPQFASKIEKIFKAIESALLKAKYKIKIPDALQLAGAMLSGASVF